ncbi:F0F1 ATP synthase subunit B [Candidatus Profftia tarda]|uniref:ATP synthase subunit b n=1 Tax=Candidatus Profftia tarda TaxID=1177216 RepID=A0A8E4F0M4_9ENTR|nr:F0F1 ATP synthase subunit B [Candidatus Profftia tarda]CAD6512822.1 ATP synthase subunit b [Candidatus Profftia tarda]
MNLNATILGQAAAFILFVWFCMNYVWPPIMEAIKKRQKEIHESISKAEHIQKDLELAQIDANKQLRKAKTNARLIIEQANKRKAQIIDEAKAEGRIEFNKIITQAQAKICAENKRTREELRKEIALLAIAGAEKIIERSVHKAGDSDIFDKLIAKL